MSESSPKDLKGFAALMHNQFVRPLKDSDKFKEKYKDTNVKLFFHILDATDSALLIIKNGTIDVIGIAGDDEEGIENANKEADAKIETNMETFVKMEQLSTLKMLGKMITGKLKIKGGKHLKLLQELRKLAEEEDAQDFF
jgi:hypothetical protein